MLNKFKRHSRPKQNIEEEAKLEEKPAIIYPKVHTTKKVEGEFKVIKDYSSFLQLSEMINKEISQTKSKIGEYLLQIVKKRALAEKSMNIRVRVFKLTEKKQTKGGQDEFEINGLQIVLDATPRHEIKALTRVIKSYQDRLLLLQKTKIDLKELNQLGQVQVVNFL
jgi:hypothetical protein